MTVRSQTGSIEELRRRLIVAERDIVNEQLELLIDRTQKYCLVDEDGRPHIRQTNLSRAKQIVLCLIARYLASRLVDGLTPILSADELALFLHFDKAEVVARAKELVDEGFVTRTGKGKYRANHIRISDFFDALERANR